MRAHGGEIQCLNNAGEPGSTFMVRIPVAESESRHVQRVRERGRPMSLQSTMWTGGPILLIEDEPSVIAFCGQRWSGEDIRWSTRAPEAKD